MPALDIGDEAFDLLFYAYKKNRWKWLKDGNYRKSVAGKKGKPFKSFNHPYLTDAGTITSGTRLEGFLEDVGSYEDPYYQNKRESMEEENDRMRRADEKAGRDSLIPTDDVLDQVEQASRELYHGMLVKSATPAGDEKTDLVKEGEVAQAKDEDSFKPVTSSTVPDAELIQKLGGIFRDSMSPDEGGVAKVNSSKNENKVDGNASLHDLKGRYYFDKFGFTPFDAEKHLALRKEYIKGLVWNLEYYYKGVASWEWYYPYHYGPMLSDLRNINSILSETSFTNNGDGKESDGDGKESEARIKQPWRQIEQLLEGDGARQVEGRPLRPFEQLLGCLPPSSSYLLPEPYRWLMTSPDSPLIE